MPSAIESPFPPHVMMQGITAIFCVRYCSLIVLNQTLVLKPQQRGFSHVPSLLRAVLRDLVNFLASVGDTVGCPDERRS